MTALETSAIGLRRVRLVDEVTRHLRELIISGELQAGTQLPQIELAERLGVSRTPLREAFRVLEADGLVRTSNKNRTVEVVTITSADLREMYEIREVIDGLAARRTAQVALTKDNEVELRHLLDEMEKSAKPYDPVRRTAAHARFHSVLLEWSGSGYLQTFQPLVRVSSAALYLPFVNKPSAVSLVDEGRLITHAETLQGAQDYHVQIAEAVLRRDSRKAESLARRHISSTLRWVGRLDEWRQAISEAQAAKS